MPRMFRPPLAACLMLAVMATPRSAFTAELSQDAAIRIVNASHRLGETLIDQGHTAAEIRKILTFYVKGEVASELHPDTPEAPLSADEAKQVQPLVDKVMASLPAIAPVDPTPAPVTPPGPGPVQPVRPEPAPAPKPEPGQGPVPVFVWVVTPASQPAPAPVIMPAGMPFAYPGFAPPPMLPGGAPTIHIKHGWFGHPDKVWYSRH